jgi:hypothetical protein
MTWLSSLAALLLLGLLAGAAASSGDESPVFRRCTLACEATGCTDAPDPVEQRCTLLCPGAAATLSGRHSDLPRPPLTLRLWQWDCSTDCRYLCMWQREEGKGSLSATPPEKYFGKWPFARALGMQEPASVAFSLLNMAAQLRCLHCCLRLARRASATSPFSSRRAAHQADSGRAAGPATKLGHADSGAAWDRAAARSCRRLWAAHFCLSAAAWLCSAAFHGRDTRLTERLDYYTAGTLVAFNTFLTAVRTLRITGRAPQAALGAAIVGFYLRHVYRMQFLLFDYGLHVRVCIAAGLGQAVLWVYWAVAAAPRQHPGRRWLLAFVAVMHASMLFEVLDFAPLWHVLDAHACWHLCTVPLAYIWYQFVSQDFLYGCSVAGKQAV